MGTIDLVILLLFVFGAVRGLMRGFFKQVASLLGLIVGLLVARAMYMPLADKISPMMDSSMTVVQIISFVVIWLAVPIGFSILAHFLTRLMEALSLGWLNRWLGAGMGAIKYLILVSLVIGVIEFIDRDDRLISKTKKESSVLYYPMKSFAGIYLPVAKNITEEYILKR